MIIYYCPGTGWSLSSQYSLQESVLKIFSCLYSQYCSTVHFPIGVVSKIRNYCRKVHSTTTVTLYFCGACSNFDFENTLLKLPIRSERATGALTIVNHHIYRSHTLLASNSGGNTPGTSREHFLPMELQSRTQVQNPTHVDATQS